MCVDAENRVQEAAVAPIDLGALRQTLLEIGAVRGEAPHQERAFEVVEVGVDGGMCETEARGQLGSIPDLSVNSSDHGRKSLRDCRSGRQPPIRQVSLHKKREVIDLPLGEGPFPEDATVGQTTAKPEAIERDTDQLARDERAQLWASSRTTSRRAARRAGHSTSRRTRSSSTSRSK